MVNATVFQSRQDAPFEYLPDQRAVQARRVLARGSKCHLSHVAFIRSSGQFDY